MTELWLVDLERTAPALEALESVAPRLSAEDRARAHRIGDLRERRHRLAAYMALRVVLERIAGRPVRGATFVRPTGGKPHLSGEKVAFSLSHSERFALVGVTRRGEIGVDLEEARGVRMSARRLWLIAAAGNGLGSTPLAAGDNEKAFLQAWSRLEAFAKARGSGLARLLADVGVRGSRGRTASPARVEAAARRAAGEAGLKVRDLELPHGLHGAVALSRQVVAPRVQAFPVEGAAIGRLLVSRQPLGRRS